MLTIKKGLFIAAALAITVVPAAASSIDRGNPSNFSVWAFLTFCGLIIVAQILPLLRKANESTKMIAAKTREKKKLEAH
ncbi:MAG: hypothetical protein PHH91_03210 [Desulfuromonadaceae bacterium]|nr:hypothetical protein [Desulfuromonadaceae bacterium]